LKEGKIVVCDRYVYSSGAYQGAKFPPLQQTNFLKWLEELEYKENQMPKEDLNIFLDVPVRHSFELQKKTGRKKDLFEESVNFLESVRGVYMRLKNLKKNWVVIECLKEDKMRSREEIHQEIVGILKDHKVI